ncbi:FYVE, RhoGEF and PH domain-containing protein 3, partial [Lamellibrachia satsuma]
MHVTKTPVVDHQCLPPRTMSASQLKSKDFDQIDSEPSLHRNLSNVDDQDSPKRPPVPPGKKPLISDLLKLADLNRTGSSNSDDANAGNDDVTFMERPLPPPPPSADKKPSISKLEKLAALEEIYSRDSDCNSTDNTEETISEECSDAVDENIYEEVKESLDEAQNIRPKNKLEHIANELLSTEEDYVKKLSLLVRFRSRVIEENLMSRMFSDEVVDEMFLNILNIYKFHQYFMLPELQQTLADWESKQKLGDVMKQLAPYLKLTTEYVTNFDHARNVITEWQMKSPKFASIISSLEENVKKTLKIRESFCGNDILNVISTDSKVIKEGEIIEISAVDGHHQIRYLFLFNDVLLVGASRHSKYRLMGALSLEGMQ